MEQLEQKSLIRQLLDKIIKFYEGKDISQSTVNTERMVLLRNYESVNELEFE